MKLHEALRKILKQFGTSVMQDGKRLMSMMADFHAFEDYPAMKKVMGAVFTGRYGKELFTRAADDESDDYRLYIGYLRESLVQILHFREEFASYAVDSVSFALGLSSSVAEPHDNGYDPCRQDKGGTAEPASESPVRPQSHAAPASAPEPKPAPAPVPERMPEPQSQSVSTEPHSADWLYQEGEKYYYGRGVRQDYAEAAKWYRASADKGSADAEYSLGHMYLFGLGVRQSSRDAANWFLKAAAQGHAKARKRLENIMPSLSAGE